jgi:hypothetical protein
MPRARRIDLGLRSKGGSYTLVVGVVIGLLAAGLGIPFVFGEPLDTVQTSTSLAPREAGTSSTDPARPDQNTASTGGRHSRRVGIGAGRWRCGRRSRRANPWIGR